MVCNLRQRILQLPVFKRNETKHKQNETKRNETKQNEAKRNETKRNETLVSSERKRREERKDSE
jgi:hypothetical protein